MTEKTLIPPHCNMSFFLYFFLTLSLISPTSFSQTFLHSNPEISNKFRNDTEAIQSASTDYGHIVHDPPLAIFNPTSTNDIQILLQLGNNGSLSPNIAPKGQSHSVRGQAMADKGIVVNMISLSSQGNSRINVSENKVLGYFADVGGEQIWIDVLQETVKHGLTPVSWTDYLYLSVGGTLSNAGISGQSFRFGPQITNVYEMDVITGKGDLVTASPNNSSELFHGVLGGLGQFGIITRARIALVKAPTKVKWLRLLYTDFSAFTKDQESLISMKGRMEKKGVDYVEGFVLMRQGPIDLSFYPIIDQLRVVKLVKTSGIVYGMELAKYYDDSTKNSIEKEIEILVKRLSFVRSFVFEKDVGYVDFLNRVKAEEDKLRSIGMWDIPHPWMNLFVPKSRISDFDSGVFRDIFLKQNVPAALLLIYPTNKDKWDDRMSAMTPDEDVFYAIGLLHASGVKEVESFDNVNKQILQFCQKAGILMKQYLPHYETQADWANHFGSKWKNFQNLKVEFDPKKILSPGQKIF
ncbi:hypothetical protein UlMin_022068 [Ulmus minor]